MAAPSSSSHFHAKLGGLRHRLLLDTPQRVYYGNDVPVTGHVLLKHLPLLRALPHSPLTAELFGPLRVDVVLRGSARINHLDESRAECIPLCREVVNIHHAPLRISPDAERKLPFSLRFPIESVDREPLPPTIDVRRRADTWGTLGTTNLSAVLKTAVTVQYTLETQVSMPGIEVDVQAADPPTGVPLYYDRLRLPASTAGADQTLTSDYSHPFTAQNDALRPESEQPQGLRSKTKALLKPLDLPRFVFEASFIGIPRHAYIEQPLSFAVTVVPDDESSTTKIHPNVFLDSCTITLVAHTTGTQPPTIELLRTKEANFSSAIPFGQD